MTTIDKLAERHILEHESHLKHIDELLERASNIASETAEQDEIKKELAELEQQRTNLLNHIDKLKQKSQDEWQEETIEEAGPMVVWELVAKRLEKLIERIHA